MIKRIGAIMKKELQLLSRSKSSTVALLFGPLLIILLVGLVFSNAGESELIVGIVAEDFEGADEYSAILEAGFSTVKYDTQEQCAHAVREGTIASCVGLEAGEPPTARIYVDPSDVNLVYEVIDRVTGQLENRSAQIRQSLTSQLLESLGATKDALDDNEVTLGEARAQLEQQTIKIGEVSEQLGEIELDVQLVTREDVRQVIDETVNARDDYAYLAITILDDYEGFVNSVSSDEESYTGRKETIDEYTEDLDALQQSTDTGGEQVFAELLNGLEVLDEEIRTSKQRAQALTSQTAQVRNTLSQTEDAVGGVLESVARERARLSGIDITQTDIASPINPVVEPVVADDDALGFIFPYFLTLLIMFTAILLSSSMIVRERESAAYFRNFTTSTPDWVFVVATYLTTLTILIVQLLIISLAAAPFSNFDLLSKLPTLFILLLFVVTLFDLLGMVIGYSLKTREGVMLAGIAVASVLLFLSGIVFPLQNIPGIGELLINMNPFVISAEMIKAILLFSFTARQLISYLLIILLYSVIMFALIMIVQRLARIRAFERSDASRKISEFLGTEQLPQHKELVLGNSTIRSKKQLLRYLKKVTDETYEKHCDHKINPIADWIRDVYKDDGLARKLRNKSREGAIAVLEKEF